MEGDPLQATSPTVTPMPATAAPTEIAGSTVEPTEAATPTPGATPFAGGGRIAFLSQRDSDRYDVFLVELSGQGASDPRKVTENDGTQGIDSLDWRPDREALTFSLFGVAEAYASIVSLPAEGGGSSSEHVFIPQGVVSWQVWSPDGSQFLCTQYEIEGSDVWVFSVESNGSRQVTELSGHQFAGDWLPDGGGFLFYSSQNLSETAQGYTADLNVFLLQSGEWSPPLQDMRSPSLARFSPDGSN